MPMSMLIIHFAQDLTSSLQAGRGEIKVGEAGVQSPSCAWSVSSGDLRTLGEIRMDEIKGKTLKLSCGKEIEELGERKV